MQRVLARILVLALASLVGVGLAELAVRFARPQVTMYPRYVSSSEYAIEMMRDAEIRHARGGRWSFTYSTNAIGRRGPYLAPEDVGDRRMVIVLGDSFTFGIGVEDDQVYTAGLREALGEGWGVVNGGMSGWGIDSQIKWFREVGAAYAPEAVVLQFTANDPWDSDTGVTEIQGDEFVFHPYTIEKPAWQEWVSGSALLQRSHLFSLLRSVAAGGGGGGGAPAPPDAAGEPAPMLDRVQDRYVDYLRLFARSLDAEGIRLHFLSVTSFTDGVYGYDLVRFPRIEAAVAALDDEGVLEFVELPLEEMARMPVSPEGHQWGAERHGAVVEPLVRSLRAGAGNAGTPPG